MKYVSIERVVYKVDHLKGKGSMALHLEYKESILKPTLKWEHKRQDEPRHCPQAIVLYGQATETSKQMNQPATMSLLSHLYQALRHRCSPNHTTPVNSKEKF